MNIPEKLITWDRSIRIGIDGQSLQGRRTGIGRYVFELCRKLDACMPNALFFVYSRNPIEIPVSSERWISRIDSSPYAKYLKPWLKFRCASLCQEDNLDVFWGGNTLLPSLPKNVRKVMTVYDLNYKIVPETMTTAALWQFRLFFKKDLNRAHTITTISQGTSDRLFKLIGRKADVIIPPAVSPSFRSQSYKDIETCRTTYGIHDHYILAVATWEPRKNLELLIKTFISMKREGLLPYHRLVLVGGKGWKDQRLSQLVQGDNGLNIVPLGYVPDEHLPLLYAGADVFVFPSVYEGFGMPVLEARACGTKVVTTDIPELREAGGKDTIYITPTQEGIRAGIIEALLQSPDNRKVELDLPSWESGAQILARAFNNEL